MSGTEARANLAGLLERDLLGRFDKYAPPDGAVIARTAELAASLAWLDSSITSDGVSPRMATLHHSMIESLMRGLSLLGTDRIEGTSAETILKRALATQSATLALLPPAGHA